MEGINTAVASTCDCDGEMMRRLSGGGGGCKDSSGDTGQSRPPRERRLAAAISIFVFGRLSSDTCKFRAAPRQQTVTLKLFTPHANEE